MANISSYNQLSSWNEDDDLLFVQQPDAPKKAHPSQIKEYILEGLDVSSVGGSGKYVSAISETDGKISATAETMDAVPTEGSSKAVTSGGIKTAIDDSVSLKTATGNPITLTDAANATVEELSMTIEPIQSGSGDPSPTNVRPISGISEAVATRCGFNIWDEVWELGRYDTYTGEPLNVDTCIRCKSAIKVNSGLQLYFKFPVVDYKRMVIYFYDKNDNFLSPRQILSSNQIITVPANAEFLRFYMTDEYGATYNNDICINVSDTNKNGQYEPYTAATATITFGQTVYGGSVNFKTGEVTVTHKYTTVGDMSWSYESASTRFGAVLSDMKYAESLTALPPLRCSAYKPLDITTFNTGVNNAIRSNDGGSKSVWIRDTSYTDATAFKTAMSGVQLCYELATPTTLTLTPAELELLKGNNTITANGAEISLSYYPDNAIGALAGRVDAAREQIAGLTAITPAGINISAYNSASNQYTAPTDGYVRMELRNANHYFYLYVNGFTALGGEGHQVINANDYMTVFVRKGMKLYYTGTVYNATFFSLT